MILHFLDIYIYIFIKIDLTSASIISDTFTRYNSSNVTILSLSNLLLTQNLYHSHVQSSTRATLKAIATTAARKKEGARRRRKKECFSPNPAESPAWRIKEYAPRNLWIPRNYAGKQWRGSWISLPSRNTSNRIKREEEQGRKNDTTKK